MRLMLITRMDSCHSREHGNPGSVLCPDFFELFSNFTAFGFEMYYISEYINEHLCL
jgi:hypothetical protein